jgi:succinyl-diaminopimelate desuccinylase
MIDVAEVLGRLEAEREAVTRLCADLVRIPSENPPGDTRALAAFIREWLAAWGHSPRTVAAREDLPNLVCTVRGAAPGPALILNGHLDTYPAGTGWSVDPFGGLIRDERLYGRGVGDMKAGVTAALVTFTTLAELARELAGRLTLTLVSDEESGGALGAGHVLATDPEARGDACLIGDAGSADVVCFAEKGAVWVEAATAGRSAHSAHVHLGQNAIHALLEALRHVLALGEMELQIPEAVRPPREAGRAATPGRSEAFASPRSTSSWEVGASRCPTARYTASP